MLLHPSGRGCRTRQASSVAEGRSEKLGRYLGKTPERNQASVGELVELAAAEERLVKISSDYYLHADVEREMRDKLTRRMAGGDGPTVSQVRERLETTRKYAVPFCEYLDRTGFTKRQADVRVLADG